MASLLALSRAEQERAKTLLRRRLWAHVGTLVLGLVALIVTPPAVYALPVLALLTEATAWYLRFIGIEAHTLAEEGRRRAFLIAELGSDPDSLGTAAIRANMSDGATAAAAGWEDPQYFASDAPPGPRRVRESLQESAFWSCRLYRTAGRRDLVRLILTTGLLAIGLLALFSVDATSKAEASARAVTVALATLISADLLGGALSYVSAAATCERVLSRLDAVDPHDIGQLLAVYGDYATGVALAAPIPTRVYQKQHDKIDAAWRGRHKDG